MNTKQLEIVGGLLGSMFFRKEPGVKEVVKHDTETQARIPFYRFLGTWIGTFTALSGGLGLLWLVPSWEWHLAAGVAGGLAFGTAWLLLNCSLPRILAWTIIAGSAVGYGVHLPDQFWIDNYAWIFGSAALLSLVLAGALYAWQQGREQSQGYQPMPEHLWAKAVIEDLLNAAMPENSDVPRHYVTIEVKRNGHSDFWDADPVLLLEFSRAVLAGRSIAHGKWRKRFEDWPGGFKQFRTELARVGAITERGPKAKAKINREWFEKAVEVLA